MFSYKITWIVWLDFDFILKNDLELLKNKYRFYGH